jgi:hypothetical protein
VANGHVFGHLQKGGTLPKPSDGENGKSIDLHLFLMGKWTTPRIPPRTAKKTQKREKSAHFVTGIFLVPFAPCESAVSRFPPAAFAQPCI